MVEVKIFVGNDIPKPIFEDIQKLWSSAFKDKNPLWDDDEILKDKDVFFIVIDKGKALAAGRLRRRSVIFGNIEEKIMGIADVACAIKKRGYGTMLLKRMCNYLKDEGLIGIGFANKSHEDFYRKGGFMTTKKMKCRFEFLDNGRKIRKPDQLLVYYDESGIIQESIRSGSRIYSEGLPW